MSRRKLFAACLFAFLFCLLLSGCGTSVPYVHFSFATVPADAAELTAILTPEDIPLLDQLPQLRWADFSGSACYEEIYSWGAAHPEVELRYTVPFPDGADVSNRAEALNLSELSASDIEQAVPLFYFLPELKSVNLGEEPGKFSTEQLLSFHEAYPQVQFIAALSLGGQRFSSAVQALSLPELDTARTEELIGLLPLLPMLKTVDLGAESEDRDFGFEALSTLQFVAPEVRFEYSFKLFGKTFSSTDTSMDLNHVKMKDGAAVREAISCMPELRYLDMDSCGVSNEDMAALRDDFPDVKVVWRVWFGRNYSVRTDVEKILASRPSAGGNLTDGNTEALQYCTDVKYLDIGHNETLKDVSFVSCMPKLEVLIIAMSACRDATPLASCTELEYLEIQTTELRDLTPLSGLTKLKHLNIAHLPKLKDIRPLYSLTQLERLWIGYMDPIPEEQIKTMRRLAPDCEINTTTVDPTGGGWRYTSEGMHPRYELLVEQFGYLKFDYAFIWRDPLY